MPVPHAFEGDALSPPRALVAIILATLVLHGIAGPTGIAPLAGCSAFKPSLTAARTAKSAGRGRIALRGDRMAERLDRLRRRGPVIPRGPDRGGVEGAVERDPCEPRASTEGRLRNPDRAHRVLRSGPTTGYSIEIKDVVATSDATLRVLACGPQAPSFDAREVKERSPSESGIVTGEYDCARLGQAASPWGVRVRPPQFARGYR